MKESGNLCKIMFFRILFVSHGRRRGKKVLRCICSLNIYWLRTYYVSDIFLCVKNVKENRINTHTHTHVQPLQRPCFSELILNYWGYHNLICITVWFYVCEQKNMICFLQQFNSIPISIIGTQKEMNQNTESLSSDINAFSRHKY